MTDALILGYHLDTNGQNTRYVRAAEKHGMSDRITDILAIGKIDPGGVVARLQEATERHPEAGLRIRSAHRDEQYFQFPNDLRWGSQASREMNQEVRKLAALADVIHFNNSDIAIRHMRLPERGRRKPMLLHHHGSLFRNNPSRSLQIASHRQMVQAVSTVDLQQPATDVLHWLPTAYDVAALRAIPRPRGDPDRVRVGHFPTNRKLKHTDLFLEAIASLRDEGLPIDLVMVEHTTNDVVMGLKATCDIVYDQLAFGYGCNSVEAWGMGIPVIAGADTWTLRRMQDLWGYLPFLPATTASLKGQLRKMVKSRQMRQDYAGHGMHHVLTYHDELPALAILAQLYADAIRKKSVPRIQGKGVQFRSRTGLPMHIDGIPVDFEGGIATVTDEVVIEQMRGRIKRRPGIGVEEVA